MQPILDGDKHSVFGFFMILPSVQFCKENEMKKMIFFISILFIFITSNQAVALPEGLQPSTEKMLIGSWEVSVYISPAEIAQMLGESLPQNLSIALTGSGSHTYHVGGKCNTDGQVTLRLNLEGQELPLNFLVRHAGTWEIHDNIIVETNINSVVIPNDPITMNVVNVSPEYQSMFTPGSGDSTSMKIIHISEKIAELKMMEPPYRSFTLRKKIGK